MIKKLSVIILLLVFFQIGSISSIKVFAQQSAIAVKAKSFGDSVVIRWAPTTPEAWEKLNSFGYRIERFTIIRDGQILDAKPKKELTITPLKPANEMYWLPYMEDDMVALMAQAIFGESFEVSQANSSPVIKAMYQTKELEARYSFALFSADISSKAAQLGGLRWVDKDIKNNEKYLYRIHSLIPDSVEHIDFGFVYVSPDEINPLPEPQSFELVVKGKTVVLSIDAQANEQFYTAYQIERSDDNGNTYQPIHKQPLVSIVANEETKNVVIHTDSLPAYGVKYFYRFRGIDSFGEWGPYAKPIIAMGQETVQILPKIEKIEVIPLNTISIRWTFPTSEEFKLKGFEIERASLQAGPYVVISREVLKQNERLFEDRKPLPTNYYRLRTLTNAGDILLSNPYLIQLEDSIPPSAPIELKLLQIDTTGIVKFVWKENTEQDLLGYHVYRSNFKNAEFSRISINPIVESNYADTISLDNLSSTIYYKVSAIDYRFNTSTFSSVIEVVKPDIVPPAPPVVKSINANVSGIEICWVKSSSTDVAKHYLYRSVGAEKWIEIQNFADDTNCYTDKPELKTNYQYKLVARDKAGLESSSAPFKVFNNTKKDYPTLKISSAKPDREKNIILLTWNYVQADVSKFIVYRAEGDSNLTLYKTLKGDVKNFSDINLKKDQAYTYRIQVIFKNGDQSPMGEPISVRY